MKSMMKLPFVFVSLMSTVLLMSCSDETNIASTQVGRVRNTSFSAREAFSFSRNVGNHSGLRLDAINGSIAIVEVNGLDSVRISGEKIVESENAADAATHLKELGVVVQDSTGEVLVKTTQPSQSGGRNYVVNYTIILPKSMVVNVSGVNGLVSLDEIVGSVSVDLVNGEIISKLTLPVDGTIDMSIANGNIVLDIPRSTSAQFEATVVNGSIIVSSLDLQNKVETLRSLRGTLGAGQGTISLSTINGGVTMKGFGS